MDWLHDGWDEQGHSVLKLLSEGQVSDDTSARHLLPSLPTATSLIAHRGYDAEWFPTTLWIDSSYNRVGTHKIWCTTDIYAVKGRAMPI